MSDREAQQQIQLATAPIREKEIRGSGGSLDPPGPLLTHLHTVYIAYSECLPTRLNPLAERAFFSQAPRLPKTSLAQQVSQRKWRERGAYMLYARWCVRHTSTTR
jgi:hypothetical protein